jgi:hypothetical protein
VAVHDIVHRAIMQLLSCASRRIAGSDLFFKYVEHEVRAAYRLPCKFPAHGRNLMRKIGMALAIAAVMSGSVATAQSAYAAQSSHDTNAYTQPAVPAGPKVQLLDCRGTTGSMGCGPGWFWRDGWRGWACYPC